MWSTAYCILVVALTTVQGSNDTWSLPAAPNCKTSELPGSVVEWRESNSLSYSVEWSYGNGTCSSLNSCFDLGLDDADDQRLDAQITPLHIQPGDQVRFFASQNMDIPFAIFPHRVDEEGFINCDISRGKPIVPQPSKEPIAVLEEFLRPGVNYFITNRSDTLYQCRFGLRVNITVKIQKCNGPGGDPGKCWNQGRCLTSPLQTDFQCSCCNGFTGDYCFEEDGCATEPCLNGGSCVDLKGSQAPKKFACSCPQGWIGDRCETRVANQCVDAPCENNATCIGNADDYRCECPHGFTGHHCTVNIDDCATDPCDNGFCVDQIGGYQCYCTPGYGGHNCDMKYSPCRSNPCKNNGYCIDRKGDYECHCDAGYTGPHCTQKVNLCGPSACFNATECIDNGNTFECVCAHGFKGHHCEIDINECEMKPCENGGKCLDAVGGYTCLCLREFQGKHCELSYNSPGTRTSEEYEMTLNFSQTEKLYIIAATLAGALILALVVLAICYCKVHETYKVFTRGRWKNGGYVRQTDQNWSTSPNRAVDDPTQGGVNYSSQNPRTNPDAIIDVSTRDGQSSNVRTNLVSSLKPKRV